jgi:uncharacterized Zn-binding protein involved in type VI secretion
MKHWNRSALLASLAFSLPCVLIAQSASDPINGTWSLNAAKSSYEPGPAPKSDTRTWEATAEGAHLTVHLVDANGNTINETTTYKRDGKPYAFKGSKVIDGLAVTRINAREERGNLLSHGRVIGHVTAVVSKDGKTLTMTGTIETLGRIERDVRVYDRLR